jgi:hypothetical protein
VCANIPKIKKSNSKALLVPGISDKAYSTCIYNQKRIIKKKQRSQGTTH